MSRMKVLVLIDGIHGAEIVNGLARVVDLRGGEVLLAYVEGPDARAGLELIRQQRPGARPLPPYRERDLREAEDSVGGAAMAEAEFAVREHGASAEPIRVTGKPGHAVCNLAVQRHADLVVVRAGGRDRPPGPGSLGPAARFITDHSRVPVLLLRTR